MSNFHDPVWEPAAHALESYSVAIKQTPWRQIDSVCAHHERVLGAHVVRLPHNAPPLDFLQWESGPKLPDFVPSSPFKMVKVLMRSIADQFRLEALLAPEGFVQSIHVGTSLTECEKTAAQLADLLSAAPDWRLTQAAQWSIAESLERFTSFLRWESSLIREHSDNSDTEQLNYEEVKAHAMFLVKLSQLVNMYTGFIKAVSSAVQNPGMLVAVASRCGSAAVALERCAKELVTKAGSTDIQVAQQLCIDDVGRIPRPSILNRIVNSSDPSNEVEKNRQRLVENELQRSLQERDAALHKFALEDQRVRQDRRELSSPLQPLSAPASFSLDVTHPVSAASAARGHFQSDDEDEDDDHRDSYF
eukprot:TRINITY_DN49670_c0_g1_i1.p1 TRINITY_DN49670_c0_g1~~TRINITY_DN49670_c0_g1_i1.p1  ORF type:complete len:374 (-),score=38.77 TRINITY_DN49670_c0_g1_i1:11-1093(-)